MLSASVLLWYHRQSRKGKPMHAASETNTHDNVFLLLSFAGIFPLNVSRAASMRYTDTKAACRS
nr:MAG TPA: hypothetical protein [Caudoviricetes sp.]